MFCAKKGTKLPDLTVIREIYRKPHHKLRTIFQAYLQELNNFRNNRLDDVCDGSNAIGALLAGPLLHKVSLGRAGSQLSADHVALEEGGVDGKPDDSPVDANDSLAQCRVLV